MGDSEQENEGDDGREFTEAHVFQKIPELENQAEWKAQRLVRRACSPPRVLVRPGPCAPRLRRER